MGMPDAGPISLGDIGTNLLGRNSTTTSLNEIRVREAVMNKDEEMSLSDFYSVPCGMYKDFTRATPGLGYTHAQPTNVQSEQNVYRKPVSSYNLNNNRNSDPWEDMLFLYWNPVDNKWSTQLINLCWLEPNSARYELSFSYCSYGMQGMRGDRFDVVAASYPSQWVTGAPEVHLVETVKTGTLSSGISDKTITWDKRGSNQYTLISLQMHLDPGYTGHGEAAYNNVRIKKL